MGYDSPGGHCVDRQKVNLGITALEFAEAKVFANIDGSVNAQLSLEASNTITSDTDLYFEGTAVPQNSTFRGCTEVGTGISVNVGADGSLFGIVEGSITKELFSRNFTLFQVCSYARTFRYTDV